MQHNRRATFAQQRGGCGPPEADVGTQGKNKKPNNIWLDWAEEGRKALGLRKVEVFVAPSTLIFASFLQF
jgi:hypothetical protein